MSFYTSIKLRRETKEMLEKLKVHHRQSYDEVIRILIERVSLKQSSGEQSVH